MIPSKVQLQLHLKVSTDMMPIILASPIVSLTLSSHVVAVPVEAKMPNAARLVCTNDRSHEVSDTMIVSGAQDTGIIESVLSYADRHNTNSMARGFPPKETTVVPTTQPGLATTKDGNAKKAKKSRKTLLSRPLALWPPRQVPRPGCLSIPSVARTSELGAESVSVCHISRDMADESLPETAFKRAERTCVNEAPLFTAKAHAQDGELISIKTSDKCCIETPTRPSDGEILHENVHVTTHIADPSIDRDDRDDRSSDASHKSLICFSQTHKESPVAAVVSVASSPVLELAASLLSGTGKPPLNSRSVSCHGEEPFPHPRSTKDVNESFDSESKSTSQPVNAQEVLHGVSHCFGAMRVEKASRQSQSLHRSRIRSQAAVADSAVASRMSPLDLSLSNLRSLFLADQCTLQDQVTSMANVLQEEKVKFQNRILEQDRTIAELRLKLRHLSETVMSKQKYVAGLQNDHETMKTLTKTLHEKTKAVQEQIVKFAREKEMMQQDLNTVLTLSSRTQKAMLKTMQLIQLHYLKALCRENGLKVRLDERALLYDDEKKRRIELERQLLGSVNNIQYQLNTGSKSLFHRLDSLKAIQESRAADHDNDGDVQACLQILRKLNSLPLMTSCDVQKVERLLQSIYERQVSTFRQ